MYSFEESIMSIKMFNKQKYNSIVILFYLFTYMSYLPDVYLKITKCALCAMNL